MQSTLLTSLICPRSAWVQLLSPCFEWGHQAFERLTNFPKEHNSPPVTVRFFFVVLSFELRASCLLGRHSTT
jgi:hypothetical protein